MLKRKKLSEACSLQEGSHVFNNHRNGEVKE